MAAVVLSCTAFVCLGLSAIADAGDPGFEDTGSYLEGALIIQENGGPLDFIRQCVTGTFRVAEQHPGYLLVLSTFASRDLVFFRRAQLATLAIGLIVVVALFLVGRRVFDEMTATVATLLLCSNAAFLGWSSHVSVEALVTLFVLLAWAWTIRGLDERRYWLWAGLAAGCAFMTKATALLLVPAFLAFVLPRLRSALLRDRYVWGFLLFFVMPCVPWIIRNVVVYQTPMYEGINHHTLWVDRWEQLSDPANGLIVNWREHTYRWNALPTMFTYLNSHSAVDIVLRAVSGIKGEASLLVSSLTPSFTSRLVGAVLLLIGLSRGWRDIRTPRAHMTLLVAAVFLLPYAWYFQVVPDERFIAPLIPIVLLFVARGLVEGFVAAGERLAKARGSTGSSERVHPALAAVLLVFAIPMLVVPLVQHGGVPEVPPVPIEEDQEELFGYLRDSASESDVLLVGPTRRYWGYLWYARFPGRMLPTAGNHPLLSHASVPEFTTYLRSRGVTTVVVHEENIASPQSLERHFVRHSRHGLSQILPIEGWRLMRSHSVEPVRFLVYRVD